MTSVICSAIGMSYTYGQLSPGPLTHGHSEFEGIKNCTQCHDIGNKIPDTKCLVCHIEIESLINQDRGFHASIDVSSQECVDCHSEHHGRKFDMVRFDQENFDHTLTGYELEGEHGRIECRDCHKAEYIRDPNIGIRDNTFLGLEEDCLSCHHDFHKQTLSQDCTSCHDFETWRPASLFDHDDAKFKLRGQHVDVDCIECHKSTLKNGVEFQEFTGMPFNSCVSCHDNPHQGQLTAICVQCHTESSFSNFKGAKGFDHNRTGFELKGSHQSNDCFSCHNRDLEPRNIFQEFEQVGESNCLACHQDTHEGKFGSNCIECHNEESFLLLNDMDLFDHNLTDYPLEGLHTTVDCKECHLSRYTDPIAFNQCSSCHDDYHQGELTTTNSSSDCVDCHGLDRNFTYTLYTLEHHQEANFPLEESHLATPCFSCHLQDDRWTFRNIGTSCVDCHEDIHQNFINEEFYPEQNCTSCHSSDTWTSIEFDHGLTDWNLDGQHAATNCASCHFEYDSLQLSFTQVFSELENACIHCHENIHGDQFELEGVIHCIRCHQFENWVPELFDHDQAQFPLDGKHRGLDCSACHISEMVNDESIITYKIEKFACIDCHL